MKNILILGGIVVLIFVGGVWWSKSLKNQQISKVIEGVKVYEYTDRTHVVGPVVYEETPPVGGRHNSVWVSCNGNFYDTPVIKEQAVHSLEHGAVWITYKNGLAPEQVSKLKEKLRGYTFVSPFDEQDSAITLTAWNNQLKLESADDPRIDQFLKKFRQGPQTPEPGATCDAVPAGMNNPS